MNISALTNEGGLDRAIRVIVGVILLALVFVGPHTPWGWIGLVPLLTGLIGWCPAYSLLGMRTCPLRRR
ncbi:YgaP family membrane protein [Acidithiobacillus acidisediminis]|uniref:YgaP family membrane protein n=1 Tax=Acidithiobacillus acidisediminis TaxID=2937799 RepID=UPI00200BD505